MSSEFNINDYSYELPKERIAKFPLEERSKSKLLLWNKGAISHHLFEDVPGLVPPRSCLVFNDTKVIAARLFFQKPTGAKIEIFLLHPERPTRDIAESMLQKGSAVWTCLIGNKKKWKDGKLVLTQNNNRITASYYDKEKNHVRFTWDEELTFAELINSIGQTPLPPYLNRKPVEDDANRYQTIYSENDGAVAAPTAGLHFTKSVIKKLEANSIKTDYLTLHVSAGTFKPVEAQDFRDHDMHREQINIKKSSLLNLVNHHGHLIAVGTTSLRILESLYWYGVMLAQDEDAEFRISKDLPHCKEIKMSFKVALDHILNHMERQSISVLYGETEIYIYPGYKIRSATGLFTNFHLPKSTLLLLVSCFTGQDWKSIYSEAMKKNYRFLSYGDSSLLLR